MDLSSIDTQAMARNSEDAARFLKTIGHPKRLQILCYLAKGERNVMELEQLLDLRQSSISQQLAQLRRTGMVTTRREAKHVYYRIADPKVEAIIGALYDIFCAD